ncbi:MAG TPA: hypothetical protein VI409_00800 [Gaiellaceae bacterium]|nr:hypothetical protein [Gaiellaceae bacterium]
MDGTGRTLEEAFDDYAQKKAQELRGRLEKQGVSFAEGLEQFDDAWFTVDIAIRTRPNNQWVKGFRVSDPGT